ncbi:hypothetical protein OF829_04320 [Sphingomonas sp. LB-2]|uniref:hypothetical protein n=1 Tax=Sphingomonas caeni TaxID=2984949 RepID=UPI00222FA0FB|nr:hypothetical protein [Sphingomonas caeni]MCW3846452.1 hypothetical protein [Sphingomonas caeni]
MTSAGDLLNGGFEVIKRRPGAVLAWAAIHGAYVLAVWMLVMPMFLRQFREMATAEPGPGQFAAMQGMNAFQGINFLTSFGGYFVGAVLLCGAFRTILRPDEPGFASLRLGWDEMRTFGIMAVLAFAAPFVIVLFGLTVMLLGLLIGFALQSVPVLQYLLIAVLVIASIGAIVYVWVRISLIFPLTFLRQKLVIDEAWKISGGRFWKLFLPYVVVFAIVMVLSLILMIPVMGQFFAEMPKLMAAGDDPEAVRQAVFAMLERMFSQPFGMMGLIILMSALIQAVSTALYGGIMATAALGFLQDDGLEAVQNVFD